MIAMEKRVVAIFVDRASPEHWIVRDLDGEFWLVPPGEQAWDRREPYTLTDDAQLEPVPGHYKYLLGIAG